MSHDARAWVWDHSRSKGTARMVLTLIADRCLDLRCVAYASVPALMKRGNASRTAVRDAIDKLIASGELVQLDGRKGPRGETYYQLPAAARFLAERAAEGDQNPTPEGDRIPVPTGPESDPADPLERGSDTGPRGRISAPWGNGFRPGGGTDSGPQNSREPKVNGKSSSSTLTSPTQWQIDDETRAWARQQGHLARLGEHGLQAADEKWRANRATWPPRPAAAWAADWRTWITNERTADHGRRHLRGLPGGGTPTPPRAPGMTRSEEHMAALLAALDEPIGME
ncbi:helix-turn-helix domain-containing protein [Streptomyces sp. NPDC088747]|uniref:helix-turn-helix domain-containing protein n=1 Tax=Streptomyces sp. NPDC088747 TaxID=3365886 RepID=UPI0038106067